MEGRKWEDMNPDCLVKIFGRVELVSRVSVIPLVCKPWYQAVLNPLCWEKLIFPPMFCGLKAETELIKFVVNRSQRRATFLALPMVLNIEALIYASEELPALRTVALLCGVNFGHEEIIPSLIVKWKNLESLILEGVTHIKEILEVIHIHLPNFAALRLENMEIGCETASAIGSQVPKLRCLIIKGRLKKEDLILILQGCKELEYLNVRNCIGFDEADEDILRLSSGLKNFQCDGSTAMDPFAFLHYPIAIDEALVDIDFNKFNEIEAMSSWLLLNH